MLKFEVLIALTFIGVLANLCLDAYAANEKCCICQRRMSKFADRRIFMSSKNFEHDFIQAFGVDPNTSGRHGFICRVCVLALRKWRRSGKSARKVGSGFSHKRQVVSFVRSIIALNLSHKCHVDHL